MNSLRTKESFTQRREERKEEKRAGSLTPDSPLSTHDCFFGADEKNRTSTALRQQASETCASTSSATSARVELLMIREQTAKLQDPVL